MWKSTTILTLIFLISSASAADTLTTSDSLSVNQSLLSVGHHYEFGFFPTSGSSSSDDYYYYLGIWYYNVVPQTVVWVGNRDSPVWSSSASLRLGSDGRIILSERGRSETVLFSNNSRATINPFLQILDTGNLVVKELGVGAGDYLWQSFDYPTDTLLPAQKLGWYQNTERYIRSWKSANDPSTGNYSFRVDRRGEPEIYLVNWKGMRLYRSGPWVGQRFSGVPEMKPTEALNFTFINDPNNNNNNSYYSFDLVDPSIKSRLMVDSLGKLNRYTWVSDRRTWSLFWYATKDQCDDYEECGPYGVCNAGQLQQVCGCPLGFDPKNPSAWRLRDGSDGCVRRTPLHCDSDEGFALLREMKLPETGLARVYRDKGIHECREMCLRECNCTAYASNTVVFGDAEGCVMWTGDLIDMRSYAQGGQDLYLRLPALDLPASAASSKGGSNKTKKVLISVGVVVAFASFFAFLMKMRRNSTENVAQMISRARATQRTQDLLSRRTMIQSKRDLTMENGRDDLEIPLYDFDSMLVATNNFSEDNKLGQGGFGCVYKATLVGEKEVAVKRLSKQSGQGVEEFKNEVKLIARLQHRNLVRLLGCCVDKDEKMLIYEYLPNRSLDFVLFHKERRRSLDWQRRFNIICGIARGLVYLHHDSRLRIIHRDLKASNILLDGDMHPKISDFGMARIFRGDETETNNTIRVVGTYGYMAPEYAMDGLFSIKSDVFSFGVLVLEIITGKKNRRFYSLNHELNLLGNAWKMWRIGKGKELLDPSMEDSYAGDELLRCIQVGLLCVQEQAVERPTMSQAILLLNTQTDSMPQPKHPGFRNATEIDLSSNPQNESFTINQLTVTVMEGR